jgi:SAM-dependent methyltransferase
LNKFKIPQEVIAFPIKNKWIIMNIFTKTTIGVEKKLFKIFNDKNLNLSDEKIDSFNEKFLIWDISKFSNEDGLLADPSRFLRNEYEWKNKKELELKEVLKILEDKFLIIRNDKEYRNKFQRKKSILDSKNFGNFHDQLGQHLMLNLRKSPEKWWTEQKFNQDYTSTKNNLYDAIQSKFLEKYFTRKIKSEYTVVDIGCGVGYYSNMMAKNGAKVIGVDPNPEYLKIAEKNAMPNTEFMMMDIGNSEELKKIPNESADIIFMSDALLFYFVSPDTKKKPNLEKLFSDIRRILKPNGTFVSVEPHYIFWLSPWLGEEEHPYTILTEYNNKKFGVTATISKLIQSFSKGGFSITWMEELTPDNSFKNIDSRAYNFAMEFPLWQLFELCKRDLT